MRSFLVFEDGHNAELCPICYEVFVKLELWHGGSDVAWDSFLRHNNVHEYDQYNEEALGGAVAVLRGGTKELEFNPSGDGKTWVPYTPTLAVSAQYERLGSTCRKIAAAYLDIWRKGGIEGLFNSKSSTPRG